MAVLFLFLPPPPTIGISGGVIESILSSAAQRDGLPTLDDLIADMLVYIKILENEMILYQNIREE